MKKRNYTVLGICFVFATCLFLISSVNAAPAPGNNGMGIGMGVGNGMGNGMGNGRVPGELPPGLANRDQLPPGLQNQPTLPPGLGGPARGTPDPAPAPTP